MIKSLLSLGVWAFAATAAQAEVTWLLQTDGTSPLPGGTFKLTLRLTVTNADVFGYQTFFEGSLSKGKGLFSIVDRDLTGTPFTEANETSLLANVINPVFGLLDPRNDKDLGATVSDIDNPLLPGTYLLGTYTIKVASDATAGSYAIWTAADSIASVATFAGGTPTFSDSAVATSTASLQVVPEPSTALLGAVGLASLGLRRFRSRSLAAA